MGLLGLTAVWTLFETAFFIVPYPLQEAAYTIVLVSGFAAVWAWLYFASAYTGRALHRDPTLRRLGGIAFLTITGPKLINPIHNLYFTTTTITTPFRYQAIEHGINEHAEMLAATLDGDDASKAERIIDAGTRLLDLSESARRIKSHRELSPELEPLDVVPIIEASLAQLSEEYPTVSTAAELPESAVAETQPRIETALWELLDNAARHTGTEPAIDVTITAADERISIEISDDGPGVPEVEQQVLATGKEDPLVHGQGLGLFLTYWIITNLDGEISVTTTDRGTTVEVRLPTPSTRTATGKQPRQ